jgi:hypothetical protein
MKDFFSFFLFGFNFHYITELKVFLEGGGIRPKKTQLYGLDIIFLDIRFYRKIKHV